jgi:Helix-turn-helix domain
MGRPEKPVNDSLGPVPAFAAELRHLRARAGNPTYRDMARSALYSSSVLSSAANGHRLPTLPVTLAFASACGGDPDVWRHRWYEASGADPVESAVARPAAPERHGRLDRPGLPRPAQLPLRPRGFVGRHNELRRLGAPSGVPVVISGPVGVGKTELALHYAHQLATDLVDGQLYADLGVSASTGPDVLDGFLRALGVPPDQLPLAADQRAGLYRSLLVERRVVVLLDNVRDERQIRPLLAESRHSVTIVAGRPALLGLRDVRRVRLSILPRVESLAMIAAAAPERYAADPAGCDRLADLCGDLPLALDVATRKLVARPEVPLCRILARLTEPGALLAWLRIGDQFVWESLNSAYLHLDAAARALLRRFARLSPDSAWVVPRDSGAGETVEDKLVEELAEAGFLRRSESDDGFVVDRLIRAFVVDPPPVDTPHRAAEYWRAESAALRSPPMVRCSQIDCPH